MTDTLYAVRLADGSWWGPRVAPALFTLSWRAKLAMKTEGLASKGAKVVPVRIVEVE